jgi:hypothetical protein
MSLLDQNAVAVSNHDASLAKLMKSLSASPEEYPDTVKQWVKWVGEASPNATVAGVLRANGVHQLDAIDQDVKILDQIATARTSAYAHSAAQDTDRTDPQGLHVLLDQGDDVAAWLKDPLVAERRYRAARQLDGERYGHPVEGRERWDSEDFEAANTGWNLLKSLQRPRKLAAALKPAQRLDRQLERAWAAGSDPGERKKLLDAAVGGYRQELKLLDAASPAVTQGRHGPLIPVGKMLLDNSRDDGVSPEHVALAAHVASELDRRGLPWSDFMEVAREFV